MKNRRYRANKDIDTLLKLSQLLAATNTLKLLYDDLSSMIRHKRNHFISLGFTDSIFPIVAKYITQNCVHEHHRKNLMSTKEQFIFSFRANDSAVVSIEGYEILMYVSKDDGGGDKRNQYSNWNSFSAPSYLEFQCKSKDEFEAVFGWLDAIRKKHYATDIKPRIYTASSWDEWERHGYIPERPLASVQLKSGQAEKLITDLETFYASQDVYNEDAIPYHRGYMLHGPPGTGKTSFITALAYHFGKHICFMSSSSLKTEKAINDLFADVPEDAILVIEDIDTSFSVQTRDNTDIKTERATLSLMLNALDGLTTPIGLVLFMTTNRLEDIDDAILRPGRIDVVEEFSYLNSHQLDGMLSQFLRRPYHLETPHDIESLKISPAAVSEIFKTCFTDRESIIEKTQELINNRAQKPIAITIQ